MVDQFGAQASAYLASPVHAGGEDLHALAALADGLSGARVLDLGTGGGHVAYAVAPRVAEVVAYDLSEEMLAVVARTAAERGLRNVVTCQGRAEQLPFEDKSFELVVSRYRLRGCSGPRASQPRRIEAPTRTPLRALL